MIYFYLIALIPVLIGLALYLFTSRINIVEWIIGSVLGFIIAGTMHICAYTGMISDQEIWSGKIVQTCFYPFWVERYQVAIYRTTYEPQYYYGGKHSGMRLVPVSHFDHYETRYRDHNASWTKTANFGTDNQVFSIQEFEYKDLISKFGPVDVQNVNKSGFDHGDPNEYICYNHNADCIIPATIVKSWSNKVKASPSSFSFPTVPDNAPLFNYPECHDPWHSDRLLGDAANKIDAYQFDQLNAKLGPVKKVNIIIVGFNSADSNLGKLQEAKWLRGKKNDVVICYGWAPLEGSIPNICWSYCFSWCNNEIMKRNIEQIFMGNPIDSSILPLVEKEITQGFVKREWSEFDKLTVQPRPIHYKILISIMIVCQLIVWGISWFNDFNKGDEIE